MPQSAPFSITIQSTGAPAWFTALAHKQWASPVGNWLGANGVADPNSGSLNGPLDALIDEWTGMGADQLRKIIFMMANGGHNGYYGNEVYSCDLSAASPLWTRRRNADFPLSPGVSPVDVAKNNYGNKTADHSTNHHIEAEGRWFTPGHGSATYLGGAIESQWWEFNPVTNQYIDLGAGHADSPGASVNCYAAWDPLHRQIIKVIPNVGTGVSIEYQSIDNMSGAPVVTNNNWIPTAQGITGGVDTTNRVLLIRDGGSTFWLLRLTNNTTKAAAFTEVVATGSPPAALNQIHWHPASNGWLTWGGSSSSGSRNLYKLTPTVSNGMYTALVWTQITGFTGVLPPAGPSQGMYNKVNFIQDMGNGDSALIVVPAFQNPDVFICRIVGGI